LLDCPRAHGRGYCKLKFGLDAKLLSSPADGIAPC
jgi:hypothetical protein